MPLTIYRRDGSPIWHYRGTLDGHRLRGSTRTADKTTAQRIAGEKEARFWKRRLDGPEAVTTFANCVASYIAAGKPTRFVLKLLDYWRDTPVRQITARAIKDSCPILYPGTGHGTWNRQVIAPTQAIINLAAENEQCPPIKVRRFKTVRKIKEPGNLAWVQAFQMEASPHIGALALFMFMTGARISEALAVRWSDIDLAARTARIRMGKLGGEERIANLPAELVAALAAIVRQGDLAFRIGSRHNIKTQWESAIRRAGIKRLTPHCMRHGFATEMLRAGYDVKTVAHAGGWKDAATVLKTYAHAIRDLRITDALSGTNQTQTVQNSAKSLEKRTA